MVRGHGLRWKGQDVSHGNNPQPLSARASNALSGTAHIPGDKSVSHRALIFGAMTVGETRISGLLEGEDVSATADAMRAFGATVAQDGSNWTVQGVGVGGFGEPDDVIDCGNAGTGVRLIMGAMATTPIVDLYRGWFTAQTAHGPNPRSIDVVRNQLHDSRRRFAATDDSGCG